MDYAALSSNSADINARLAWAQDESPSPGDSQNNENRKVYPVTSSESVHREPEQSRLPAKQAKALSDDFGAMSLNENKPQSHLEDVWIAIMGVTGAGKSNFIKMCSGQEVEVGHGLMSCTKDVDEYNFVYDGKYQIHLIDTPGFDDTNRTDREVLGEIASWLGAAYEKDVRLSGIVYLHRIMDPRMGGVSLRNLVMFKKLCGEDCYPRVVLLTTFWDAVDGAKAMSREQELTSSDAFWGKMLKRGSKKARSYGDRESVMSVLETLVSNRTPIVLDVQREMVDQRLTLDQTAAGRAVSSKILEERKKWEAEIAELRQAQKEMLEFKDKEAADALEKERKEFEAKIQKGMEDQAKLRVTLEELQKARADEVQEMEAQIEEAKKTVLATMEESRQLRESYAKRDPSTPEAVKIRHQINNLDENVRVQNASIARKQKEMEKKAKGLLAKAGEWMKQNPSLMITAASAAVPAMIKAWSYTR